MEAEIEMEMRAGRDEGGERGEAGVSRQASGPPGCGRGCVDYSKQQKPLASGTNFRDWRYLCWRLGGMWAPVLGTKTCTVFVQCPRRSGRSGGAAGRGAVATACCTVGHREGRAEAKQGEDSLWHEVFIPRYGAGGQETEG